MPKKIKFKVIGASGEDEKYKAKELDKHGPAVRGWLSPRNCTYPQEILFSLNKVAILHQIQILAHHYIIPERVDVWVGEKVEDKNGEEDAQYEYVGYITLSNNESTRFKSRELKTVTMPPTKPAQCVKLSLHRNHPNNLNIYNQVGLVAVQIIGEEAEGNNGAEANGNGDCDSGHYDGGILQYDDLAFEMYVDKEIADLLKELDEKKKAAVHDERFEYARKIKDAMLELRLAGEKLGKLEIAKRQAIQQEDYSKAKIKKSQMEEFKKQIYDDLHIEELLEKNGVNTQNDEESPGCDELESKLKTLRFQNPRQKNEMSCDALSNKLTMIADDAQRDAPLESEPPVIYASPVSPSSLDFANNGQIIDCAKNLHANPSSSASRTNSLTRRAKSAGVVNRNHYEAYDDRAILPNKSYMESSKETNNSQLPFQSKLNEREKKQASIAIEVFGIQLVEKIFSKQFCDKEEGLRLLEETLKLYVANEGDKGSKNGLSACNCSPNKIARASIYLLHRSLHDKVYAVYSAATEAIRYFFNEFCTSRVTTNEITRSINQILPDLLSKSGDTTPRIHNLAIHTILSLAHAPDVRRLNCIPVALTRVLTSNTHARLALSKMEMVEQLILSQGISKEKQSGMTSRILAEFGLSGLHHPAESVRKQAEKILIHVYRSNARLVRKQLPPDDDITRRNILYRHLMQEFERIDREGRNAAEDSSKDDMSEKSNDGRNFDRNGGAAGGAFLKSPNAQVDGENDKKIRVCTFCREKYDFVTEQELNVHYWKYCPLLMRCANCDQVVEVAALQTHLLGECELKSLYKKCPKCRQAVHVEQFDNHKTSPKCTLSMVKKVCPLCSTEIGEGEESLRKHLIGPPMCKKHPRLAYLSEKGRKLTGY